MNSNRSSGIPRSSVVSRRTFLADCGMCFTGLVLSSMLHRDGVARAEASGWASWKSSVSAAWRKRWRPSDDSASTTSLSG